MALAALLLPVSCGLYDVVTLSPPEFVSLVGSIFTFRATAEVTEEDAFRGFELYYKLYAPSQSIGNDDNLISLGDLQSRGFRRVSSSGDRVGDIDRPLIFVPPDDRVGTPFDVEVDFARTDYFFFPSGLEPQADPDSSGLPVPIASVTLRRGIAENRDPPANPDLFKPFTAWDFPVPGSSPPRSDADINLQIWDQSAGDHIPMRMLLYVLSYGKDEFFNDAYSIAVYLGEAQIDFQDE